MVPRRVMGKYRNAVFMVQRQIQHYRSFCLPELALVEENGAELHHGGIQANEFVRGIETFSVNVITNK